MGIPEDPRVVGVVEFVDGVEVVVAQAVVVPSHDLESDGQLKFRTKSTKLCRKNAAIFSS